MAKEEIKVVTSKQADKISRETHKKFEARHELGFVKDHLLYLDTCPNTCAKCTRIDRKREKEIKDKITSLKKRLK